MRFLTVLPDLDYRGSQRVAVDLSRAYSHQGHDVAVVAYRGGGIRQKALEDAAIPVWIGGADYDNAVREAKRFRPDVIHIHRHSTAIPAETQLLGELRSSSRCVLETSVFGRFDPTHAGGAIDVHMQLGEWCLYRWHSWRGNRKAAPAVIMPYPVDTTRFRRVDDRSIVAYRQQHGIPQNGYVFGFIHKWHPEILRAFALVAEHSPHAYLLCVDAPQAAVTQCSRLSHDVASRVRFVSRLVDDSQLCHFYSAVDWLLHAAPHGETFGLVLAEAMSCGCPIVTAARPHKDNSHPEVVGHEIGGIVAGSLRQLPQAAAHACSRDDLRDAVRMTGHDRIVAAYDLPFVAKRIGTLAELVLGCEKRGNLARAIEEAPNYQTTVSSARINQLLYNTFGVPELQELALMRAVHNSWFYPWMRLIRHGVAF